MDYKRFISLLGTGHLQNPSSQKHGEGRVLQGAADQLQHIMQGNFPECLWWQQELCRVHKLAGVRTRASHVSKCVFLDWPPRLSYTTEPF